MIRKHLADAGVDQKSLHVAWDCKPKTVHNIMSRATNRRALSPQHVDAFIAFLKLDDFDATRLHKQAAREAGFHIDGPSI